MSRYAELAAYSLSGAERPAVERPGLVIALHGLTGDRTQPLDLLASFAAPTFVVLAPDLRAHGDTRFDGEPGDFTRTQLADDVVDLVDHLGLRPEVVRVVGISLGAAVALELTRRAELPVDRAVLVRLAHLTETPLHLRSNLTIARLLREDPATALDRLLETADYRAVAAVSAKAAAGLRLKVSKPRSAERVLRLEHGTNWTAFDVDSPTSSEVATLVVGARADPLHPVAVAEEWHRRLPGSQLALLPAYDTDPEEHGRQTRALVQDFLGAPLRSTARP